MKAVNIDVINKWISDKLTEMLGFEDEILIGTIINMIAAETVCFVFQFEISQTEYRRQTTPASLKRLLAYTLPGICEGALGTPH